MDDITLNIIVEKQEEQSPDRQNEVDEDDSQMEQEIYKEIVSQNSDPSNGYNSKKIIEKFAMRFQEQNKLGMKLKN